MSTKQEKNGHKLQFAPKSVTLLQGILEDSLFDQLKKNKIKDVCVLEGRPDLASAKESCRQLLKRKITPILISDNMAGFLFYKNLVKDIWVGYQYCDQDGALCDIGALILGVLGKRHKVNVNLCPAKGKTRFLGKAEDITSFIGTRTAPAGVRGYVPLVEWLPRKYITRIYS